MEDYIREIASPGPGRECGECGDIRYEENGWRCSCDDMPPKPREDFMTELIRDAEEIT